MQKFVLADLEVAVNNIFHNGEGLTFRNSFAFLEVGAEIALRAQFCDDVAVSCLADYLVAPENVGMLQFGEGLYLAI